MKKTLKILNFSIVTLTAFVLLVMPELGFLRFIVAMIMPIFAGIMRFINDFDDGIGGYIIGAILRAILRPLPLFILGCFINGLETVEEMSPLFVIISYISCCYIMFKDFKNCNCDDCNCDLQREHDDYISANCTTD